MWLPAAKAVSQTPCMFSGLHFTRSPAETAVDVMDARLIDGVNALPLAKDAARDSLGMVRQTCSGWSPLHDFGL